jgi:hypothetical protein
MIISQTSSIDYRKYYGNIAQYLFGFVLFFLFSHLHAGEVKYAGEVENAATPSIGTESSAIDEGSSQGRFSIGDGLLNERGFSTEDGSVNETDFSKETGFSRQNVISKPAGFSNHIIITTGVERDSNPGQEENDKKPVWIYSITPQILLDYTSEVNRLYLNAALVVQQHSNESVLTDREDPRLIVGWDRTYESGMFGFNANYTESSSRGEELRTTGVFRATENTSRTKEIGAVWEHRVAPRWTVLTQGDYSDNTFTDVGSLSDYTLANVRSKLTYQNSERLNTYVQLGYGQLSPDKIFKDTDIARLAIGADYELTEALTISSRGAVYNLSGRQSDSDWEAGVRLGYNVGRVAYRAELNRELGASGIGGFQKTDLFGLGWLFNVSEVDTLGASYILSKSKRDRQVDFINADFREISAFYQRILSGNWRGQANVSFRERDSSGTYSNGNLIGVSLVYDGFSF